MYSTQKVGVCIVKKDEIIQFLRNYILPLVMGIVIFNQTQLPSEMADLRVAISEIQRAISDIKGDISEIKDYTGMVGDQNSGNDSDTGISVPSTEVRSMVATVDSLHAEPLLVMFSSQNAPYENQVSGFPKETVVAYNDALETEYTTEQLCKNKLLLRCLEEDIEVFFYGQ